MNQELLKLIQHYEHVKYLYLSICAFSIPAHEFFLSIPLPQFNQWLFWLDPIHEYTPSLTHTRLGLWLHNTDIPKYRLQLSSAPVSLALRSSHSLHDLTTPDSWSLPHWIQCRLGKPRQVLFVMKIQYSYSYQFYFINVDKMNSTMKHFCLFKRNKFVLEQWIGLVTQPFFTAKKPNSWAGDWMFCYSGGWWIVVGKFWATTDTSFLVPCLSPSGFCPGSKLSSLQTDIFLQYK